MSRLVPTTFALLLVACGGSGKPVGSEGGACTSGGSCDSGLVCNAKHVCETDGNVVLDFGNHDMKVTDMAGAGDMATTSSGAKLVFVTFDEWYYPGSGSGYFASVADADMDCVVAAQAANLQGTFKAWLSTPTQNAIDRVPGNGPWVSVPDSEGNQITYFNSRADLATHPLMPITRTEIGIEVDYPVWTGTAVGGHDATGNDCGGFATTDDTATSAAGKSSLNNDGWTNFAGSSLPCDDASHGSFYCFQQ